MAIKFGRPIEMRGAPRRDPALAAPSLDLVVRPRRNRSWSMATTSAQASPRCRASTGSASTRRCAMPSAP